MEHEGSGTASAVPGLEDAAGVRVDLLRLIVRQLQACNLAQVAQVLSKLAGFADYTLDPSSRLVDLYLLGLQAETCNASSSSTLLLPTAAPADTDAAILPEPAAAITATANSSTASLSPCDTQVGIGSECSPGLEQQQQLNPLLFSSHQLLAQQDSAQNCGLGIFRADATECRPAPRYVPGFTGIHKAAVSSAAFSCDGRFVATASHDCTLRVMDVDLLDDMAHGRSTPYARPDPDDGPVVKSLYDHSGVLHEVTFHPINLVLASCSADHNIRFYDVTRSSSRRSFRYLADTHPVYSISFHPSGLYLVAGTAHPMVRMYDVRSFRCFSMLEDAHVGGVSCVRVSPDGKMLATTGFDGNIRLWDSLNSSPIATWRSTHCGELVTSLYWSRNSRYLLSSGRDNTVRLWEATSGRTLKAYYNAAHERSRLTSCLTSSEEHVVSTDEKTGEIVLWDTLSGEQASRFDSTHRGAAPRVVASRESPSLLSYGDDGRFRYWSVKEAAMDAYAPMAN